MEEFGRDAFTATMYIKRCGRKLLEKCWSVWESLTTSKVYMPWLWKNWEQSWDIFHEGCQECVRCFWDEGARYPVQ